MAEWWDLMSQVKFTKWECCVSMSRAISQDFFGIKKITMFHVIVR